MLVLKSFSKWPSLWRFQIMPSRPASRSAAERALVHEAPLRDQLRDASRRVRDALARPWIVWAVFIAIVGWDIWVHLPSMNQKFPAMPSTTPSAV